MVSPYILCAKENKSEALICLMKQLNGSDIFNKVAEHKFKISHPIEHLKVLRNQHEEITAAVYSEFQCFFFIIDSRQNVKCSDIQPKKEVKSIKLLTAS
jgi:hypothetical protein